MMKDFEVEERIHDFFRDNYEMLKLEGGHSMTAESRQIALQQVLLYWKNLKDVATHVTDTEVKLNLPGQTTPAGRAFGIEGVVDIVRDDDRTVMYDVKTHAPEQVRDLAAVLSQPAAAAFAVELVLVPEGSLRIGAGRRHGLGDVLNIVRIARDEGCDALGP